MTSTLPAIFPIIKSNLKPIPQLEVYPTPSMLISAFTEEGGIKLASSDLATAFYEEDGQLKLRRVYVELQVELILFLGTPDNVCVPCLVRNCYTGLWSLENYGLSHRLSEKMHIMVL